ncbi:MAG: hypothetical protein AAF409_13050 [Pseudomonadota bacterium]
MLLSLFAVAGCRVAPLYNVNDATFPLPAAPSQQLGMDDYRNAIVRAGANRGWVFEDVEPGHMIGKIAVRGKHFATVDVLFDQQQFSIVHKSSQNLNYDASTNQIHPNYNSWVRLLQQDIQTEIARINAT